MQICRICMNTERKMYVLNSIRVHLYEQITGTTFISQDLLPKYVCWECDYYMSKYVAFKTKAVRSLSILTEILRKEGLVTQTNCSQYKHESALTFTDVLTDVAGEEEPSFILLESSPKINIENYTIENNINNSIDIKIDLTQDFDDDNQYSDEILVTDNFVPSSPSNGIIENNDSIEENEKSPEKVSGVKSRRKKTICRVSGNGEKKNSNKKPNDITVKLARKKIKRVYKPKENKIKDMKSLIDEIDKNIICVTELTLDEQIAEVQNRKESDNYKYSPYKCEKCFKGFLDPDTFDRHLARHSVSSGPVECPLCAARFTHHGRLRGHMKNHMYKFSCQQCNFCAKSAGVAKKHENYHKGKRHVCPECNAVYTYRNTLLSHIRIKHPSDVICQHCGLSFVNQKGLNKHVKWVHRDDQKAIPEDGPHCARCDVTFCTQQALDHHIQVSSRHADERDGTSARNAMKTNRHKRPAKKHRKITWTSKPYPEGARCCEQCDEKLPNPKAYYFHFRTVHKGINRTVFPNRSGHRHMCEFCGRLLQSAALLRRHRYLHSATKEFKCERCGKQFQLEAHLWTHKRYHCGTRVDYPCGECGKNFSSVSNRSRHMVVHKGYAYKCELCDKVFNCPENRKNHVDFVHKKKPWPKRNRGPRRRQEKQPEAMQQNEPYEADMQEEWNTP